MPLQSVPRRRAAGADVGRGRHLRRQAELESDRHQRLAYGDKLGTPTGLTAVNLKAGDAGKAKN
jgi:hypothetical protein